MVSNQDKTIYFPVAFTTNVFISKQYIGVYDGPWYGTFGRVYNVTGTSFVCYNDACHWIAVGY